MRRNKLLAKVALISIMMITGTLYGCNNSSKDRRTAGEGDKAVGTPAPVEIKEEPQFTLSKELDKKDIPADENAKDYTSWKGVTDGYSSSYWKDFIQGYESDGDDMKECGIRWIRADFHQDQSFREIDELVLFAKKYGLHIVAVYRKGMPQNDYGTPEQEEANMKYLKEVVSRYKTYIKHWEIHNEPNLSNEWNLPDEGKNSTDVNSPYIKAVGQYVKNLENCYKAIKSVDSEAVVISGGLSEWDAEPFVKGMKVFEAYKYCDAFGLHPYANIRYGVKPETVIRKLNNIKNLIATWPEPYKNIPVWITEIGYMTEPTWNCPALVDSEETKAQYLEETMKLLIENLPSPTPIFWYTLHEHSGSNGFGLTVKSNNNGILENKRLPAYDIYKNMPNNIGDVKLVNKQE